MGAIEIDLFSDTVTRPTHAMREAMMTAIVGDEQLGEDPTTNELQRRVADLLGMEAALLLPSGAMCNLVAYCVHCSPGDEVILDATAHPVHYESGGVAAVVGAQLQTVDGTRGIFTAAQVEAAVRPAHVRHHPRSRVVSIEQTTNAGGGACWTLDQVRDVRDTSHDHGLAVHMDGARLLNAVVATGTPAHEFAAGLDSVWIDLSKGLGAPMGAVLAGSTEFIRESWRVKQRLGGAMRQSGIIAAAGIHALDHHVDRLADDHRAARALAEQLATIDGIEVDLAGVETNIVIMQIESGADHVIDELQSRFGIRYSPMGPTTARAVTHLDVDAEDIRRAAVCTAEVMASRTTAHG